MKFNHARREPRDSGPVTPIQECCFRGFQCFSCAKEENMVLLCLVFGCSDERREKGDLHPPNSLLR